MLSVVHMAVPKDWNYSLMPQRGSYNFSALDYVVDWAEANNMVLHADPFVWGTSPIEFAPDWFVREVNTRADAISVLQDYVSTVMKHFKGRIRTYDLVNEPYNRGYATDYWETKVGSDYPIIAGRTARDADPEATIVLNGTWNHVIGEGFTDDIYRLAQQMSSEGVIDGVGMQMHLFGNAPPSKSDVIRAIERYQSISDRYGDPLKIYVTSADVNMAASTGSQEEVFELQARIYDDMLQAALETGCKAFYTMGNNDLRSWLVSQPDGGQKSHGTLFDEAYHKKPAYYAVRDTLAREALRQGKITQDQVPSGRD